MLALQKIEIPPQANDDWESDIRIKALTVLRTLIPQDILTMDPMGIVLKYCVPIIRKYKHYDDDREEMHDNVLIAFLDGTYLELEYYSDVDLTPDLNINGLKLRPWHNDTSFVIEDNDGGDIIEEKRICSPVPMYLDANTLYTPYGHLKIFDDEFEWHSVKRIPRLKIKN